MYPYMNYNADGAPMCYYCSMSNNPFMPAETSSWFRSEEEFDDDRAMPKPPMSSQMPGMMPNQMPSQMPGMMPGQMPSQMPGMTPGQMPGQMPGTMDMSKMDMGKIKADTQDIVRMLEQHHPDLIRPLTSCGMSAGQARQYLSRVVEMSLMHHMMHQM